MPWRRPRPPATARQRGAPPSYLLPPPASGRMTPEGCSVGIRHEGRYVTNGHRILNYDNHKLFILLTEYVKI
uniref:Uncharacterized protein n=1 Tax=Pararge aegeria TaxID=116150 RepID=S4PNZ0_9NEOP